MSSRHAGLAVLRAATLDLCHVQAGRNASDSIRNAEIAQDIAVKTGRKNSPDRGAERLKVIERQARTATRRAGILSVAASLLALPQAFLVADALGSLAAGTPSLFSLPLAAGLFVLLGCLRPGLDAFGGRIGYRGAQRVVAAERRALLEAESLVSPFSAQAMSSAAAASLIGEKLDLLTPYLTRYHVASTRTRLVPLAILVAACWISWTAAVIFLISGPLVPVFMALIGYAARDASEKHLKETGSLNALLLERLNAMVDIKLLDGRDVMVKQFFASAHSLKARTMAVLKIAFLSSTVLELFSAIGIAMVAVYVGFSLLGVLHFGTYGAPMSLVGGMFLLLLAPDFFAPLRELANAWHDRAAALAVAGELAEAEQRAPMTMLGAGRDVEPLKCALSIATRDLGYVTPAGNCIRYPDFAIHAGETIAISGVSGVGKSTLLALLAGLARPSSGEIRIAENTLVDDNADAWRQRLCWVAQTPHFANASLRANVVGEDGIDYDRARFNAAMRAAGLDALAETLPQRDLTRLGESGAGLSGGEGRRLMLARAFYQDADVILADEPTADLDTANADRVIDSLAALARRGKTLIVATHDRRLIARLGREIRLGDSA